MTKNPLTIGACGFNATGSSAVIDYLREFNENVVVDQFEFTIAHMPDGLQDLKYHLFEGSIKHTSSCMALDRFQRLIKGYPSRMFSRYCGDRLLEFAEEFLDSISQCEWIGSGAPDSYYFSMRSIVARLLRKCNLARFYRKAEERADKKLVLFPYNVKRYSCRPSNYDVAARRFVGKMLDELGRVSEKNMVLDQPFAGNNPQAAFPFFENPVAIVVDRDPRDYYLLCKKFYYPSGWRLVPCNNVESFVAYFRSMRESMPYLENDSRILRIRFEDMVYEYETTTKRIRLFCHLGEHATPYRYFDPRKSIHNTNLASLYPDLSADVAFIEKALPEYLYPFEQHPDMSVDGDRHFFL